MVCVLVCCVIRVVYCGIGSVLCVFVYRALCIVNRVLRSVCCVLCIVYCGMCFMFCVMNCDCCGLYVVYRFFCFYASCVLCLVSCA